MCGCMIVWVRGGYGYVCLVCGCLCMVWAYACVVAWLHGCKGAWLSGCPAVCVYAVWAKRSVGVWLANREGTIPRTLDYDPLAAAQSSNPGPYSAANNAVNPTLTPTQRTCAQVCPRASRLRTIQRICRVSTQGYLCGVRGTRWFVAGMRSG